MIHGTRHIVFEYSSTEYELEEVRITKDETIDKEILLESELANEISIYNFDERHEINCLYNVYKDSSVISRFKTIWALRNNDVYLKYYDGNWFKDSSGNRVLYRMNMKLTHYETADRKDYLLITFRSLKPVDFVQSALDNKTILVRKQDMIFPLTDSDGNIQLYED